MHNISLIFRSSVWDPAGATSSKVYKRLGLQQVHTQRPEILQSLFKCPANSWSCWLLLPGSWSQLQFSASPVCLFSLPWDLNSLMELSCWFSVCSVFLCCEGRSDDLQALFMLEMKLEVRVFTKAQCVITATQQMLPYSPLVGEERCPWLVPGSSRVMCLPPSFLLGLAEEWGQNTMNTAANGVAHRLIIILVLLVNLSLGIILSQWFLS